MLRLWNFSCAISSYGFISSLLYGIPLYKETGTYLLLQLSTGIWVISIALRLSVVFLLIFVNVRGHWTAACTLGGTVGSQSIRTLGVQSIVTRFCPGRVPVYTPPAVPENSGVSHCLNAWSCQVFQMLALRAAEWCYCIVVWILSWWIMTLITFTNVCWPL